MKFHYRDKVKIIGGFYMNSIGIVKAVVEHGTIFKKYKYLVNDEDKEYGFRTEWVWEENLEKIED
jgi:hypothetical protein